MKKNISNTEQERGLTGGKLVDSEVTRVVFPSLLHTYWYPRLARRITGATSPVSMAAQRRCAMADSSSLAKM